MCVKLGLIILKVHTSVEECLRLQGLPTQLACAAREMGLSDRKIMEAAGNAWPVNVVAALIKQIRAVMEF